VASDHDFEPDIFRLVGGDLPHCPAPSPVRLRRKKPFLSRMPWDWLQQAARLPGSAWAVGLCLWKLSGCRRSRTVPFRLRRAEDLGVSLWAARHGLRALERAGLVAVERHPGRNPIVTLRDVEDES
jgi:hypothetical protein